MQYPGSIFVPSKQTDSKTKDYGFFQPHDSNQRPHPFPHFSLLPLTCPKFPECGNRTRRRTVDGIISRKDMGWDRIHPINGMGYLQDTRGRIK